jgi:hypothetical protein
MSDIDYTIAHKDNVPEYLSERWGNPGTLGENHLVYRGQCTESICTQIAQEEEEDITVVLAEVLSLMNGAAHEPIVLCKRHINAVQEHYAPVGEV